MTREGIDAIRARCQAATAEPWTYDNIHGQVMQENLAIFDVLPSTAAFRANGEFVACAREDIPRLLDALEEAQRRVTMLEDEPPYKRGELRCVISDLCSQVRAAEARVKQAEAERDNLISLFLFSNVDSPCTRGLKCPHASHTGAGVPFDLRCSKEPRPLQYACWLTWAREQGKGGEAK